jgi:hypothetical protein
VSLQTDKSVVFVVEIFAGFIGDTVFVPRRAAGRQLPFQEAIHGILAAYQLARSLNARLKVLAFVSVERRRTAGEFGEEPGSCSYRR